MAGIGAELPTLRRTLHGGSCPKPNLHNTGDRVALLGK
jgi:hypothetical protein